MEKERQSNLEAVHKENDVEVDGACRERRSGSGTELAGVRCPRSGIQIRTKMELSRQEDNPEQQGTPD